MARDRIRCEKCGLRTDDPRHWRACESKRNWPAWMLEPKKRADVAEELAQVLSAVLTVDDVESPDADVLRAPSALLADAGPVADLSPLSPPAPAPRDSDHGSCCGHVLGVHVPEGGMGPGLPAICMGCPDGNDVHPFVPVNQVPPPPAQPAQPVEPVVFPFNCECGAHFMQERGLRLHRLKSRLHRGPVAIPTGMIVVEDGGMRLRPL